MRCWLLYDDLRMEWRSTEAFSPLHVVIEILYFALAVCSMLCQLTNHMHVYIHTTTGRRVPGIILYRDIESESRFCSRLEFQVNLKLQ